MVRHTAFPGCGCQLPAPGSQGCYGCKPTPDEHLDKEHFLPGVPGICSGQQLPSWAHPVGHKRAPQRDLLTLCSQQPQPGHPGAPWAGESWTLA